MSLERRIPFFYGWLLVGVGLICYGFGISPGFYSWGYFGPELREDLNLTAEQSGSIFGVFQFMFSAVGPLVGIGIARFGLRTLMTGGAVMCALGFWMLSRADSVADCYVAYSLIGGIGIGFSTILPCQTLASYWFQKYRARAMAIIFTGGALVGMGVNPFNAAVLEGGNWRDAWEIIAWISLGVAVLSATFIRNSPATVGMRVDGIDPSNAGPSAAPAPDEKPSQQKAPPSPVHEWTTAEALRTPQFLIMIVAGLAYSLPWGVIAAHGGLHLRSQLGMTQKTAGTLLGSRVFASTFGRLSASMGDFISPTKVLAGALIIEAVGVVGMAVAQTESSLYPSLLLVGFGFGLAYLSVPVVFARYFGARAFATTAGTRIMINGVFGYLAPRLAGAVYDRTETFAPVFWVLACVTLAGAVGSFLIRSPRPPEAAASSRAA